ncbi:MAG: DegT/DnrJ/EryC1/StrS family aminotransferase [Desulfobacterales bacterium]|nr:DegT/DnrJ/EryC1/StrS family aminotransferase [Desulfobacterales bacterium]MCP4162046.1 DegT/DnrJ/EryC1/StrS family aminotransferase [Deltaproteobacteria bacterium]
MQVPLLDLKKQYQEIKEEVLKVTEEIYESQYFILGPHVEKLEKEIAEYCDTKFSLGVSSGTDALIISLMCADIGKEDIVLTTPYTFFATAGAISRVGAKPLFADIDPSTYNISPDSMIKAIENLGDNERSKLKAIMPVHLYGQCADMDQILDIAKKYNLVVIEDAAQAIGSEFKGKRAGSMGDFGCFSFFPSKNLGAFGDGGIVTTNSSEMFEKLVKLRNHGSHPKYYHEMVGGNFRLDALQAAIVSIKLKHLDSWTKGRQENAEIYRKLFKEAALKNVKLPEEVQSRHIYNQFIISVDEKRDELRQFINDNGIGNDIYYPVPLHLQNCFTDLGYKKGDFPNSESAADSTIAIPIYPDLNEDQLIYVVETIKKFYS